MLRSLNLTIHTLLPPLMITALCTSSFLLEFFHIIDLGLHRETVASQPWQLILANFTHTNGIHLWLNLFGLWLIWGLHREYFNSLRYGIAILTGCLTVTSGILLFTPSLVYYAGLSGVLHALVTVGAYEDIKRGVRFGWLLLLGVSIKVIYEQIVGPNASLASAIDAQVAIDAHLYGVLSAGLTVALLTTVKKIKG